MPIAIIALVISLAAGGGAVTASQTSLPTDALYPVKIATEQIQEAITFNNTKKIDLSVKLAEKRLDEIKLLQTKAEVSPTVIEKTLINYEKHLAKAQSQLARVNGNDAIQKVITTTVKYENSLEKQQEQSIATLRGKDNVIEKLILEKQYGLLEKVRSKCVRDKKELFPVQWAREAILLKVLKISLATIPLLMAQEEDSLVLKQDGDSPWKTSNAT